MKTKQHEFDEDGCCKHCFFDGAEWWWDMRNRRLAIGEDEYHYCKQHPQDFPEFVRPECIEREV